MQVNSHKFKAQSKAALLDIELQAALNQARGGFIAKRADSVSGFADFEQLRTRGETIKNHVLANLDDYLMEFERNVASAGGRVHWASTPKDAVDTIASICRDANASLVAKGKSMIGEEINLNHALEAEGLHVVETDLGEYIIQLADEHPSHIIAPAIHKTRSQISDLFHREHAKHGLTQRVEDRESIVNEARQVLRDVFVSADVGIIGSNFLIADTGSTVLVTNEGNGDLSSTMPRVQIVTASIEKIIPSMNDLPTFLRLLGRSATGQEISAYTSIYSGPKRPEDRDGPQQFHVVLLDNGRSTILASEYRELLRCIRCGACMNHCPVYLSIGGHAYGWVYPGPMGSVWTPLLAGLQKAANLPNACTLNGRCEQVCPMRIPLPRLLLGLRRELFERGNAGFAARLGLKGWEIAACHPALYRRLTSIPVRALALLGRKKGFFRRLPIAGRWTSQRDFPAPAGGTFVTQWHQKRRSPSGRRNGAA